MVTQQTEEEKALEKAKELSKKSEEMEKAKAAKAQVSKEGKTALDEKVIPCFNKLETESLGAFSYRKDPVDPRAVWFAIKNGPIFIITVGSESAIVEKHVENKTREKLSELKLANLTCEDLIKLINEETDKYLKNTGA